MNSKHENSDIKIVHGKQDRHCPEEIDTTEHLRFELFPQTNWRFTHKFTNKMYTIHQLQKEFTTISINKFYIQNSIHSENLRTLQHILRNL